MSNKDLITIFNSHSGDSFKVNRHYFVTLEELKKFCSKQFNIPIAQIFLISPFGLKLKITFLEQLDEVYVFDRNLFSIYNDEHSIRRYIRGKYSMEYLKENLVQPIHSPLEDVDLERFTKTRNARQLIGLLTTNLGWVSAIRSDSGLFAKRGKEIAAKSLILLKALKVACQYIESYCGDIKKQFDTSVDCVISIQKHSLNLTWNDHLNKLTRIYDVEQIPLSGLLNKKELSDIAHESIRINENVNSSFVSHRTKLQSSKSFRVSVDTDLTKLEKEITAHLNSLEIDSKLQTVNTLCDKLQTETKNLLSQSNNANTIDDISIDLILESFTLQKSQFVNQIYSHSSELYSTLRSLIDIFNKVQLQTCTFLQRLSQAQADMVTLKESLKEITTETEFIQQLESKLCLAVDLPLLYGLFLTECLRREEWSNRVKRLAASTNEGFAVFKEREVKVRSTWVRNYGEVLSLLGFDTIAFNGNGLLNFDLNLTEEVDHAKAENYKIIYDDVVKYIEQLQVQEINSEIINLLTKSVNEIPTKLNRLKFIDPKVDPEASTTITAAEKETVKGLKTRIKKLENLLHQKSFQSNIMTGPPESKFSVMAKRSVMNTAYEVTENDKPGKSLSPTPPAVQGVDSTKLLKLQDENMLLTTDLKTEKNRIETINDQLRSLKQTLANQEFENQTLVKRLENVQDEKTSEVAKLQLDLTMMQADKVNVESVLQRKSEELEDKKQALNEDLQRELEEWKRKFQEKETELQGLREREKENEDMFNGAKKEVQDAKDQLDLMNEEKKAIQERLKNSTLENNKLNDNSNRVKKENKKLEDDLKSHKKDIDSLNEDNSKYTTQVLQLNDEIMGLKEELETYKSQVTKLNTDAKAKDNKINEHNKLLSEKDKIFASQTEELESIKLVNKGLQDTISKQESKLQEWEEDYDRLSVMKNDLLENMSNREAEFAKEKTTHHEEIESLKGRIEELEQLQEDKAVVDNDEINKDLQRQANTIFQLVIIINSLIIKSRDLSEILFQYYEIFCSSLKSLGLLVVKGDSGNVNIIRVKGLKKIIDESTLQLSQGLSVGAIADVEKHLLWTELPNTTELMSDLNQDGNNLTNSESLDSIVETLIENYNLTSFEEKYINFVSQITNLTPIYQSQVAKRFREVENLAKKELKENRKLKQDIQQKITIRDFKKGDLVLFLPTSKDHDGESDSKAIQWAAFNDMRDVKFLKKFDEKWDTTESNKGKQWFIGKVMDIEIINKEQGEFMISAEEVTFD